MYVCLGRNGGQQQEAACFLTLRKGRNEDENFLCIEDFDKLEGLRISMVSMGGGWFDS